MKRDQKQQIYVILVLLMFVGSSIAIAVSYIFPQDTSQKKLISFEPLADSDEAQYFKQNMVVLRIYTDDQTINESVSLAYNMINNLNGKLFVEMIDTVSNSEIYDNIKSRPDYLDSEGMPIYLIRGQSEKLIQGNMTEDDLLSYICPLYFNPIDECTLIE